MVTRAPEIKSILRYFSLPLTLRYSQQSGRWSHSSMSSGPWRPWGALYRKVEEFIMFTWMSRRFIFLCSSLKFCNICFSHTDWGSNLRKLVLNATETQTHLCADGSQRLRILWKSSCIGVAHFKKSP